MFLFVLVFHLHPNNIVLFLHPVHVYSTNCDEKLQQEHRNLTDQLSLFYHAIPNP